MSEVTVRPLTPADGDALLALIDGLAGFESLTLPDAEARLRVVADIGKRFHGLLAEVDGRAVGYAAFFETYTTFEGLPLLYLEDIFVEEEHRGTGAGLALFRACAEEALRRGCDALEWEVLDWNKRAKDFYERLGGSHQKAWQFYRLGRDGLQRLSDEAR